MTEELYFSQLKEQNINLEDKRNENFCTGYFLNPETVFNNKNGFSAFFIVINKLPSQKWSCSVNVRDSLQNTKTCTKEYDSYYKILMESKDSISSAIKDLLNNNDAEIKTESISQLSTEAIAGTWSGEEVINKVVIMRGGRGFVIFRNGASMNISVKITTDENNLQEAEILQTSGNNASYFPDIERKTALEMAVTAEPVRWKLKLSDSKTLSGTKETFVQTGDNISWSKVFVTWKKFN